MRETCLFCVSKHIAQAIVLTCEAKKGYPFHLWLAVGHLAEAEDESMADFPHLSNDIRVVRMALMGQEGTFDNSALMKLLESARRTAEAINGIAEEERIKDILKNTTGCRG